MLSLQFICISNIIYKRKALGYRYLFLPLTKSMGINLNWFRGCTCKTKQTGQIFYYHGPLSLSVTMEAHYKKQLQRTRLHERRRLVFSFDNESKALGCTNDKKDPCPVEILHLHDCDVHNIQFPLTYLNVIPKKSM
jgi:hypothetical protein